MTVIDHCDGIQSRRIKTPGRGINGDRAPSIRVDS